LLPRCVWRKGFKGVIGCANGAGCKVAPQVVWELEADVI